VNIKPLKETLEISFIKPGLCTIPLFQESLGDVKTKSFPRLWGSSNPIKKTNQREHL